MERAELFQQGSHDLKYLPSVLQKKNNLSSPAALNLQERLNFVALFHAEFAAQNHNWLTNSQHHMTVYK